MTLSRSRVSLVRGLPKFKPLLAVKASDLRIEGFRALLLASLLSIAGCGAKADDLLALGNAVVEASGNPGSDSVAGEHEIGTEGPWSLVFVPRSASIDHLRTAGVADDVASRIDQRSATWRDQNCLAYIDGTSLAFAEWPDAAGSIKEVIVVRGQGRQSVRVHLDRSARPAFVTKVETP